MRRDIERINVLVRAVRAVVCVDDTRKAKMSKSHPKSERWLSASQLAKLVDRLQIMLSELDAMASETQRSARRYQALLLTLLHSACIPQRAQVYRQLKIDSTLKQYHTEDGSSNSNGGSTSNSWRFVFDPRELFEESADAAWKSWQALEYQLPSNVGAFVSNFLARWRPLLLSSDPQAPKHSFLFLSDQGEPIKDINTIVKNVTNELCGKSTPAHFFRSIVASHTYNRAPADEQQTVLQELAQSMCNTPETLLKNYIIMPRLEHARSAQSRLTALLEADYDDGECIAAEVPLPRPRSCLGKRSRLGWSKAEIEALQLGIQQYGHAWADIRRDTTLGPKLQDRSAVDLKDKARNLAKKEQRALLSEQPNSVAE